MIATPITELWEGDADWASLAFYLSFVAIYMILSVICLSICLLRFALWHSGSV